MTTRVYPPAAKCQWRDSYESGGIMTESPYPLPLLLAARMLELLTCGTLDYGGLHPDGHESRATAAIALLQAGDVHYTDKPGVFKVKSRSIKRAKDGEPIYYLVLVDGSDIHCQCADDFYRGGNPRPKETIICAHIIAVALLIAQDEVLEYLPDEEPQEEEITS